ncbi:hypothetical protein Hanom_Chr01g00005341 [Helianthus anomalus]
MRMMINGMMMLKMIDNDGDINDGGGPTTARPPELHCLRQWQWRWRLCFGSVWGCFQAKSVFGSKVSSSWFEP